MAYITPTDVRQYLGIDGTDDDTLITDLIARATAFIESYTDRDFEVTADTTRYFYVDKDNEGLTLYFDDVIASITSVRTNADAGTPTSLTENTHYITMPRNVGPYHAIKLLVLGSYLWEYNTNPEFGIEVTGKWGYSTSPPNDIKHACVRLVGYYYRQKDSQVFDVTAIPEAGVITVPVGVPADVTRILDHYKRRQMV